MNYNITQIIMFPHQWLSLGIFFSLALFLNKVLSFIIWINVFFISVSFSERKINENIVASIAIKDLAESKCEKVRLIIETCLKWKKNEWILRSQNETNSIELNFKYLDRETTNQTNLDSVYNFEADKVIHTKNIITIIHNFSDTFFMIINAWFYSIRLWSVFSFAVVAMVAVAIVFMICFPIFILSRHLKICNFNWPK